MDFTSLVENVAKKLGVTIDKVYPILHQKMMFDLHMDIFWSIVSILLIMGCCYVFYRIFQKSTEEDWWEDLDVVICVICVVVAIIFLIITLCCVNEIICIWQSPDYYIIQLLKNTIK